MPAQATPCNKAQPAALSCLEQALRPPLQAKALLHYLDQGPQWQNPPVAWLQSLMRPEIFRIMLPHLASASPVVKQHLFLLYRQALAVTPPVLSAAEREHVLSVARAQSKNEDPALRLLALDLLLSFKRDPETLSLALTSQDPQDRAIGLHAMAQWKESKPIELKQLLRWLNEADVPLTTLTRWTRYSAFQAEAEGQALSFHGYLARWLSLPHESSKALTEVSVFMMLQHAHPSVRSFAALRLARSGDAKYQGRLETLLKDPSPQVRLKAYEALELLQQQVPKQQLISLQNPLQLPSDAEARIRSLMRNPDFQAQLLEPKYLHLGALAPYQEELWRLASSHPQAAMAQAALAQIERLPATWPLNRLDALLAKEQAPAVRQRALRWLLVRPDSTEKSERMQSLLQDPDPHLSLEMAHHFFVHDNLVLARQVLENLSQRDNPAIDYQRLSFDGRPLHQDLEELVDDQLSHWLGLSPQQNWQDWLRWIRNTQLPLSWRREVLRIVSKKGRDPNLIPLLEVLAQDEHLEMDVEFALNALRQRF